MQAELTRDCSATRPPVLLLHHSILHIHNLILPITTAKLLIVAIAVTAIVATAVTATIAAAVSTTTTDIITVSSVVVEFVEVIATVAGIKDEQEEMFAK